MKKVKKQQKNWCKGLQTLINTDIINIDAEENGI
jgi:hypothetical protein